ncbi:hypothetical protein E4T39_07565 [Aureobasidium subglaciale]|nr:hypothetical protein E4T39_07565 [Aureobasidium subglaciale]
MPRRHAASGDMPTPQDTINVAMPRPSRPPVRLKLNIHPRQPEPEPELPPARPKRKTSRPARYSNNVLEPPTKKRRLTAAVNISPQAPISPLAASKLPLINSSDLVVLTSSMPVDKSDYANSNEVEPAGYDEDFLNNFIDDTPGSSLSALDSVIGSVKSHRPDSDFLQSDALPLAAGLMYDTLTDLASEPPTRFNNEPQSPIVLSSSLSPLSQQHSDSPEANIRKLQNACQALGGLSMPPVPQQRRLPLKRNGLRGNSTHELVQVIGVDLAEQQYNADNRVDALLAAATESDQYEDAGGGGCDEVYPGEPDAEIMLLINKAIEILHHHIANIRRLKVQAELQEGQPSQGKHSEAGAWTTETEQLVMTALESLLRGSATNIGCIISSERANLLWHLYSQLTHFVTTPHIALSRTFRLRQQAENGVSAIQRIPRKRSNVLQKGKAAKVPGLGSLPPHHVLGEEISIRVQSGVLKSGRRTIIELTVLQPMFFDQPQYRQAVYGQPPPLAFPVQPEIFLPNAPQCNGMGQPAPAAFASQVFGRHPMPTMPMFAPPQYPNYQQMMPSSFPPHSWIPVPNFGLSSMQHDRRNPFWR